MDVSVYRIVQEALTNVLKHAGAARADVTIGCAGEAVTIEITDNGTGEPRDGTQAGGHGLAGMRERVAIFGGELRAGPRPGGGFAVRARLPLADGLPLLAPAITRRLIEDFCRVPAPGTMAATAAGRLSERELGLVRLVAQGLSNAEIAARLYLSETTVKSHIARILAKLDLRDRVQIAVHAYEHGIVRPGHRTPPPGRGAEQ